MYELFRWLKSVMFKINKQLVFRVTDYFSIYFKILILLFFSLNLISLNEVHFLSPFSLLIFINLMFRLGISIIILQLIIEIGKKIKGNIFYYKWNILRTNLLLFRKDPPFNVKLNLWLIYVINYLLIVGRNILLCGF